MDTTEQQSFFTIPFNHITTISPIPYDLFINSSLTQGKDHFVRVVKVKDQLSPTVLSELKDKYHQLYVLEKHRNFYLRALMGQSDISDETKTKVIKESAIAYLETLFDHDREFTTEILNETIAGCRDVVESIVDVVKDYSVEKLYKMIAELSYHDFYTYDHSINVSMYCVCIYQHLNEKAKREALVMAGMGGLLHDLGKLKIPTSIINFPGKLSDEQFKLIQEHPMLGKDLLTQSDCHCEGVDLKILSRVVHEHHENVNGSGYPRGMKQNEIHILARITSIADFFDAITTKRSYHDVLSIEGAIDVMAKTVGKKLDPDLFYYFMAMLKKLALKGRTKFELEQGFDPCRPYESLPVIPTTSDKEANLMLDFGRIFHEVQKRDKSKKFSTVEKKQQPFGRIITREPPKKTQKKE